MASDLLVDEGRGGAPARVEQRGDLDGKGQGGEREEGGHGDGVHPSVGEELGRHRGERHEGQGGERSRGERPRVEPRNDPVALQPYFARRVGRVGQEEYPAVNGEHDRDEAHQTGRDAARAQDRFRHRHVRERPQTHVDEKVPVRPRAWILGENTHAHRQHHRGDDEEDPEVTGQDAPREHTRGHLER